MRDEAGKAQVWCVIHLQDDASAMENARIAHAAGCSGVFVISMDGKDDQVGPVARAIKDAHPDLGVGINLLGASADQALAQSVELGLDATWTDDPGVDGVGAGALGQTLAAALDMLPDHLFFGSVAFKYMKHEPDPQGAARNAAALGMVPTTSGSGTGSPPSVEKLSAMSGASPGGFLGVASGIDPGNVGELGRHVSHILVSTGISKSFHEFDEAKLSALMAALPTRAPRPGKGAKGPK